MIKNFDKQPPVDYPKIKGEIEWICSLFGTHVTDADIEKLITGWMTNSVVIFSEEDGRWGLNVAKNFHWKRMREIQDLLGS